MTMNKLTAIISDLLDKFPMEQVLQGYIDKLEEVSKDLKAHEECLKSLREAEPEEYADTLIDEYAHSARADDREFLMGELKELVVTLALLQRRNLILVGLTEIKFQALERVAVSTLDEARRAAEEKGKVITLFTN